MNNNIIDLVIVFAMLAWWFFGEAGPFKLSVPGLLFLWSGVRIAQEIIILIYRKLAKHNVE